MTDFETAAREWCAVRIEYLEALRKCRELPCEFADHRPQSFDCEVEQPCWIEIPGFGELPLDERCDNCQERERFYMRRAELGKRLPNLAKRMYAAFRREAL